MACAGAGDKRGLKETEHAQQEASLCNGIGDLLDPVGAEFCAIQFYGKHTHADHSNNSDAKKQGSGEGTYLLPQRGQMNDIPALPETGKNQQKSNRHENAELPVHPDDIFSGSGDDDFPDDLSKTRQSTEKSACDKQDIFKANGNEQHRDAEKQHR